MVSRTRDDSDSDYVDEEEGRGGKPGTRSTRSAVSRRQADGPGAGEYTWEAEYERAWEHVQEDEDGTLADVVAGVVEAGKRRRGLSREARAVQRGIIRHVVVVLDLSMAMAEKDLRPSRLELALHTTCDFITEFFEQNPISQMAVIGMRDGVAVRVSDMGGNPQDHVRAVQALQKKEASGQPSLQNALEMARGVLFHTPAHGTREVLMVYGSLVSSDPGDITRTIASLQRDRVHVRIIGLAAQVAVCQDICTSTCDGDRSAYQVVLNEYHFRDLYMANTTPPAAHTAQTHAPLIMMGFPSRNVQDHESLCACHATPTRVGYVCPRCSSKVCTLPCDCPTCSLTLVLSTHLARSYHHLFPLHTWTEVPIAAEAYPTTQCFACQRPFPAADGTGSHRFACPTCQNHFCLDCDILAHEHLFECFGCQSRNSRASISVA